MSVSTKPPSDEAVVLSAPAAVSCSPQVGPWILAATILASSMVFIDGTVVNIALPALQASFGASVSDAQWVVESFALLLGALLLAGGAAGDHFGRRRVFAIGVVLFTAASLWCGLAASVQELIVARAVQGAGGALLVPGSLAIISASFAGHERGKAIGTWSGYSAMTAALGPVLGGFLIDHFSWRYAFLINVPLGLGVLALRLVPDAAVGSDVRFGWS
jgi:MFS family permease